MSNTETTAVTASPEFDSEPAVPQSAAEPTPAATDAPRRAARGTMPPLPGQFPDAADANAPLGQTAPPPLPPVPSSSSDVTRADARHPDEVRKAFTEDPHEMHTVRRRWSTPMSSGSKS